MNISATTTTSDLMGYRPKSAPLAISTYSQRKDWTTYVVRDQEEKFYIITEESGLTLLKLFDGVRTITEIQECLVTQHNIHLSLEQIQNFLDLCGRNNLLEKDSWHVTAPSRGGKMWRSLGFHVILVKTEPLSRLLSKYKQLWFNPLTVLIACTLWLCGLILIVTPSAHTVVNPVVNPALTPTGMQTPNPVFILLPICMLLEIALHELGHTLACAYYNVRSRGWGVGLLWGVMPMFFTDTSGTYTLDNKYKRVMISLAGPLMDLMILGVLQLILLFAPASSPAWQFAQIYSVVSISLIFLNLNPFLIRLDGYWIVVDFLERPNLRSAAFRYVKVQFLRLFGRASEQDIRIVNAQIARTGWLRWLYLSYFAMAAVLTLIYVSRVVVSLIALGLNIGLGR